MIYSNFLYYNGITQHSGIHKKKIIFLFLIFVVLKNNYALLYGQRRLAGYSPWDLKQLDTT